MSLFGGGHKSAAQTPTRAMGLDLQGAQYGAPLPVVFGRNKLAGNVIDYFEFKAIAHTQKQQGGKGGGGGGQTSTSYTYSVSYLLGLHEGVGNVVNVYDGSSVRSLSSVGGLAFTGAQGQAPWSHLSGDAALGYSGTVLVAFQNKDLGSSASLPNYNFEVDGRNQFSATIKDAHPADILTAICTDSQIGINFQALGDLTAFRNYCTAAGIFFSPVYDTQNPAQSTLEDLFKYSNSAPFFSEGQLKVVPYGDETITGNGVTYTPNVTAVVDLGRDDFITNGTDDPVTVRRVAPADAMNIVRLEFKDRANSYHTSTLVASIDQDVVGTGSRADQSESADMITDGAVGRLVVQNLLQRGFYVRNEYEFQLPWRYCDLEPMDIVTLTDGNTGLYLTPVRIKEISEDEHGLLQVTAEEFPEGVSHASIYATQPNAGTGVDPNADPGPITSPYLFRGPGFLVSNNQPEIWVAVSGVDPMWAGCDVYLSQDGTSYTYLTTHSRRAAYGETTNSLATGSDPDTTGAPNVVLNGPVELLGGTMADADQFITLAMIDNELVSYQTATLAGGPSYTLGYLRRGGYGTTQTSHAAGAPFVRLDENILRIPVDPSQIGQTVYLKFVSFNVFGKGGRTLADETAYTYVVGTNIELPDVPVTPNSPAVTAVADGVSITWFNPNPAAVGCTSIEYATASGGPWTVLAQVGPTATSYVHHFTTGATYYYRLRSRGPVVAGGWSAYTAVLTNKGKTVADGADVTGSVTGVPVYNPIFATGLTGWTFDTAGSGEWYREAGGNSPDASEATYLVHKGVAGQTTTCAHNTGGGIAVKTGQTVTALVALRSIGANAGSRAYVRIGWYNSAGAEITNSTQGVTICTPDAGTNYFSQGVSRVYGTAPANAVRAIVEIEFDNHTSGYYSATSAWISHGTQSADEVPESDVRKWAAESGAEKTTGKSLDILVDGTTYARVRKGQLSDGVIQLLGSGRNAIQNPSFTQNVGGFPISQPTLYSYIRDGWQLLSKYDAAINPVYDSGGPGIGFIFGSGIAIAAGGSSQGSWYSAPFAVQPNATFALRLYRQIYLAQTLQAGLVAVSSAALDFYDASGTYLSTGSYYEKTGAFSNAYDIHTGTVPENARTARLQLFGILRNTSGSTITTAYGNTAEPLFVSVEFVQASDLDSEVVDGSTYARIKGTELSSGIHRLGIAGSGAKVGNQFNNPNSLTLNYGAVRSTTALTATSAGAVSVSAFDYYAGSASVHYNAVSNAVTGLSQGSTYFIYCRDAVPTGGTKTWLATTNVNALLQTYDDIVVAGQVTIPTSGSSGGGGGGLCVCDDMLVAEGRRAGEAEEGDLFDCMDLPRRGPEKFLRALQSVERSAVECVRLITEHGAIWEGSASTPFDLIEGGVEWAPRMKGRQVVTDFGIEAVVRVEHIGVRPVSHIHLGGCSYAAGRDARHRVYSHNLQWKP